MHEGKGGVDAEAEALAEALRRAVGAFVRVVRETTHTEKSAQSETLALLEPAGAVTVARLAQRRSVAHQTMRVVVTQLEAGGLVERRPDPADRRGRLVSLTEAGRSELARSRAVRASRIGALIQKTLSREEREALRAAIVLIDRLSAAGDD